MEYIMELHIHNFSQQDVFFKFLIPKGGKVLSCRKHNLKLHIWVMANPNSQLEERTFGIFRTDQALPSSILYSDYVGTYYEDYNWAFFHLFEITK